MNDKNTDLLKKIYDFCLEKGKEENLSMEKRLGYVTAKVEVLTMMLEAINKGAKFIN